MFLPFTTYLILPMTISSHASPTFYFLCQRYHISYATNTHLLYFIFSSNLSLYLSRITNPSLPFHFSCIILFLILLLLPFIFLFPFTSAFPSYLWGNSTKTTDTFMWTPLDFLYGFDQRFRERTNNGNNRLKIRVTYRYEITK